MKYKPLAILALTCCLAFGPAVPGGVASAKGKTDTASGEFTLTVQPDPAAMAKANPPAAGMDFKMLYSGQLKWSAPKLRIDLNSQGGADSMRLQVDVDSGKGVMLYPDTLNGYSGKLADLDQLGYVQQFTELMRKGGDAPAPAGWKREADGSEKLGDQKYNKFKLTGPQGNVVHWWVDSNGLPRRLLTERGGMQVQLDISKLDYSAAVPASTFEIGKEYTVSEYKPGERKMPNIE